MPKIEREENRDRAMVYDRPSVIVQLFCFLMRVEKYVFSFEYPLKVQSQQHQVNFPDLKVLEFNFAAVQLNQLNWRDFLKHENPIAAELMSKMLIKKKDHPKVKAECLRLLVTLKLDPAKTQLIAKFVDSYLRFDDVEEQQFQVELDQLEVGQKEEVMEIMTSWEEKAAKTIALNMLRKSFSLEEVSELTGLTIAQLQDLQVQSAAT